MTDSSTKIYIGTSGWTYRHWIGVFYPEDISSTSFLNFYTQYFDTVELNASFYHLPSRKTFENWRKKIPSSFIFAVKASRYITHLKKLIEAQEPWEKFIKAALGLKEKLGPILFQLPPSLKVDIKKLEKFLKMLPAKYEYALEARHKSWFCEKVYKILKKYKISLVWADSPRFPLECELTSSFIYLRFHGGKILYGSNYSDKELKSWAQKLKPFIRKGIKIYAYFNNDAHGYAVKNALAFKKFLGLKSKTLENSEIHYSSLF